MFGSVSVQVCLTLELYGTSINSVQNTVCEGLSYKHEFKDKKEREKIMRLKRAVCGLGPAKPKAT